jgi:hypothetical protein
MLYKKGIYLVWVADVTKYQIYIYSILYKTHNVDENNSEKVQLLLTRNDLIPEF